jgi:hypothetical protein
MSASRLRCFPSARIFDELLIDYWNLNTFLLKGEQIDPETALSALLFFVWVRRKTAVDLIHILYYI